MNRADVEMLNQAIAGLGQAGLANRQMDQASTERELDREMREKIFQDQAAARQQQFGAQQEHWKKLEGQEDNRTKLMQGNQAMQKKQNLLQTAIHLNATGAFGADARDKVNSWLSSDEDFGPTGIQIGEPAMEVKNPPTPPTAIAVDQKATELEGQADDYDNQAAQINSSQGTGPGEYDPAMQAQADMQKSLAAGLRTRAKALRGSITKPDPTQFSRVKQFGQTGDGKPAWEMESQIAPGSPLPTPPATPAPPVAQRQPGQRYVTPKGVMTWTGAGWTQ